MSMENNFIALVPRFKLEAHPTFVVACDTFSLNWLREKFVDLVDTKLRNPSVAGNGVKTRRRSPQPDHAIRQPSGHRIDDGCDRAVRHRHHERDVVRAGSGENLAAGRHRGCASDREGPMAGMVQFELCAKNLFCRAKSS
jgi:hypothetical protein